MAPKRNPLKGGTLEDMINMLYDNEKPLSNVQRMALLKEINKGGIGYNSINETKRAQALLRSLAQGRDVERAPSNIKSRTRPAVNRTVTTTQIGESKSGRPIYDVSFFNNDGTGVKDKPFKGGIRDSKLKGLNYMLGQAFEKDIKKNSTLKITATDDKRAKAYNRMTKGALQFESWGTPEFELPGADAKTYVNKKGNFQPIVKGKFTKSKPNPGEQLKQHLIKAATASKPIIRKIAKPLKSVQAPGPAVFEMFAKPIVEGMAKTIGKPGQSNMSRLGIKSRKK
jgi:hypothetical protein